MIKRNFTAALIAAGMLTIASLAQATVVDLVNNDMGSVTNRVQNRHFPVHPAAAHGHRLH